MSDLPNIVLLGHTGCGRSTAADLLAELGYKQLGFAGRAEAPHRGSPRDIVTRIWGPQSVNDRWKLIAMANAARSVDRDVWLRALENELALVHPQPAVVDDTRFQNEFFGLMGRGFVSVRLEAPLSIRRDRLKTNGKDSGEEYFDHEIEHYLDAVEADFTIENDGSRNDLMDELVNVLNRERRRR